MENKKTAYVTSGGRDYLWLDISVCDVYGMKIDSWVSILSDDTELGRIFHPESRFFFQSENESVTELEIMSMGYKSYRMDLSEFSGSRAEIKITLIPEEVDSCRQTPGLEKYVWRVRAKHLVEIKKDGTKGKEYSLILRE